MANEKIPEDLKRLFDYESEKDKDAEKSREYKYYDFSGKLRSESLGHADRLHPTLRCPRD